MITRMDPRHRYHAVPWILELRHRYHAVPSAWRKASSAERFTRRIEGCIVPQAETNSYTMPEPGTTSPLTKVFPNKVVQSYSQGLRCLTRLRPFGFVNQAQHPQVTKTFPPHFAPYPFHVPKVSRPFAHGLFHPLSSLPWEQIWFSLEHLEQLVICFSALFCVTEVWAFGCVVYEMCTLRRGRHHAPAFGSPWSPRGHQVVTMVSGWEWLPMAAKRGRLQLLMAKTSWLVPLIDYIAYSVATVTHFFWTASSDG